MEEGRALGPVRNFKVKETRPEPPGWRERDDTMEAVYARTAYLPLGLFMIWYGCVQLSKQIYRLIWIARWEAKRLFWRGGAVRRIDHSAVPDTDEARALAQPIDGDDPDRRS